MKKWIPLFFLAGCTLGPDHEVPEVCVPCYFEEAPCETDCMDLAVWWHQFDDCLLDEFIEEALACNYDLQIALHKIEEVRALYKIDHARVQSRLQLTVYFDRDKMFIEVSGDLFVFVAFLLHHMAPMAGEVAYRDI